MPEESYSPENVERLLTHLDDASLAARLVRARQLPGHTTPQEAMKQVLRERLEKALESLDGSAA